MTQLSDRAGQQIRVSPQIKLRSASRTVALILVGVLSAFYAQSGHADEAGPTPHAWGRNATGQLGDGTTVQRNLPVTLASPSCVVAVAGGDEHSLAVDQGGAVWAWGRNAFGQLGDGTTIERHVPVQVNGLTDIVAVAAGHYHSMALDGEGTVWVWGRNDKGQLGDGTTDTRYSPVPLTTLSNVVAIAAGYKHSVALCEDGAVRTWGLNSLGQLGIGTTADQLTPQRVSIPEGVVSLDSGYRHVVVVTETGGVWSWGSNSYGQLGDGTATPYNPLPGQIESLAGAAKVSCGYYHSLVLLEDNTLWAWGYNTNGQLGDGTYTPSSVPVRVLLDATVSRLACGGYHSMLLDAQGRLWTWGLNSYGQLGDGGIENRCLPGIVGSLHGVIAMAGGGYHSLATTAILQAHVTTEDGLTWVYQNVAVSTANGGHRLRLQVHVTDGAGNTGYAVSVTKVAGSGPGSVIVADDPLGDPLVKYVFGSARTDGAAGCGNLVLEVTVTGDVAGQETRYLPLTVRTLGDVNGDGGTEPSDTSLLISRLNGNSVDGFHDQAFNLDANGGIEPGDLSLLIHILNRLPLD